MKLISQIRPKPLTQAVCLGLTGSICMTLPVVGPLGSQAHAFQASRNLATLTAGEGFKLVGLAEDDQLGWVVSGAGDFNGDGLDDLIVMAAPGLAAPITPSAPMKVYLVFGRQTGFDEIDLGQLGPDDGVELTGTSSVEGSWHGNVGRSIAGIGDLNGDGFDDVMIGSPMATGPNGTESGRAFVLFGTDQAITSPLDLNNLATGSGEAGFVINGEGADDHLGQAVAAAGDVNGDGITDVIIGAPGAKPNPFSDPAPDGNSYVLFGQTDGFDPVIDLGAISGGDGQNGFRITGINGVEARSGFAVSSAGDINGDGLDDVIVGGHKFSNNVHVVFGRSDASTFGGSLSLDDISSGDGTQGFVFESSFGGDLSPNASDLYLGVTASTAGDINGDGFTEIIFGATYGNRDPYSGNNDDSYVGISYVVFGNQQGFPASLDRTDLTGSNGFSCLEMVVHIAWAVPFLLWVISTAMA